MWGEGGGVAVPADHTDSTLQQYVLEQVRDQNRTGMRACRPQQQRHAGRHRAQVHMPQVSMPQVLFDCDNLGSVWVSRLIRTRPHQTALTSVHTPPRKQASHCWETSPILYVLHMPASSSPPTLLSL